MSTRKSWLPREGFTGEVVGPIIKKTLLNPAFTLPLILLARYTKRGEDLTILHEKVYSRLKFLFYLGLARWANGYLNTAALNNWTADKYDWDKEIAVVTGGAGGIGSQVVKLLAEAKMQVIVLDIAPITFETPSNVHYFKCDITSTSAIATVAKEIRSTIGIPTILVNNAGVARGKTILDSTEKDVRFTFDVNILAHFFLVKEFVPAMVARNHGMIVTVASLASYLTLSNMVDYAASKSAALSFHEGLATELKTRYNAPKVRTIIIQPSYTRTPLFKGFGNSSPFLMPILEPETLAEEIVKKILSGSSGQLIIPGFGNIFSFLRAFPNWYQIRARYNAQRAMKYWHGRQVIDVERDYKIAREDDIPNSNGGESASTVLVPSSKS